MGAFTDLTNAILWAEDLEQAREAFRQGLAQAGVPMYAYINLKPGSERPYVDTNFPEAWVLRYTEMGYRAIDPVFLEGSRGHLPFAWRYVANRSDLTDKQRKFFADAAAHGLCDGYAVPFHGAEGCQAITSFAFDSSERMKAVLTVQPNLRLLATYYHAAVERMLEDGGAVSGLSDMELRCLDWTRRGRTPWEISAATRMTENDVASALLTAQTKLGAETSADAAEMAATMGLLA